MSLVGDLGFLADRASEMDLSITSLEVQGVGYPFALAVDPDENRELLLRDWLRSLVNPQAVLWYRGDEFRINIRGTLTDGLTSILVNAYAVYGRTADAAKFKIAKAHVDTASPADLLDMLDASESA